MDASNMLFHTSLSNATLMSSKMLIFLKSFFELPYHDYRGLSLGIFPVSLFKYSKMYIFFNAIVRVTLL